MPAVRRTRLLESIWRIHRSAPLGGPATPGHDGAVSLIARLLYLYVGSDDVPADVAFYRDRLGGEVVWHHRAMGAEVAAVRLSDGPLVLLADHRRAPSILPIWAVEDVDAAQESLSQAGWEGQPDRVEVPDGPCLLLRDPSGNEIGLLQQTRPGVMEQR